MYLSLLLKEYEYWLSKVSREYIIFKIDADLSFDLPETKIFIKYSKIMVQKWLRDVALVTEMNAQYFRRISKILKVTKMTLQFSCIQLINKVSSEQLLKQHWFTLSRLVGYVLNIIFLIRYRH